MKTYVEYKLYGPDYLGSLKKNMNNTEDRDLINENLHLQHMFDIVHVWFISEKWINSNNPHAPLKDSSSFQYAVFNLDFRSLCSEKSLITIMNVLKDTDADKSGQRMISLYMEVLTNVNNTHLYNFINKLYNGLSNVTVQATGTVLWKEIHKKYPYLWILYVMHLVLKRHLK